jgi:hypothetical protein
MYKIKTINKDPNGCVIRISDNVSIPFDELNEDYQTYLKWLDGYEKQGLFFVKVSDGNTPEREA